MRICGRELRNDRSRVPFWFSIVLLQSDDSRLDSVLFLEGLKMGCLGFGLPKASSDLRPVNFWENYRAKKSNHTPVPTPLTSEIVIKALSLSKFSSGAVTTSTLTYGYNRTKQHRDTNIYWHHYQLSPFDTDC